METTNTDTKTFDFAQFAAGTNYPTDKVLIYQDADAAYQVDKLEKEINRELDQEKVKELEAQLKEIKEKFKDSAVEVVMRGIPPRVEKVIDDEAERKFGDVSKLDESKPENQKIIKEYQNWFSNAFIAKHIVKIVRADGAEDNSPWNADKIEQLFLNLTPEGTGRIAKMTQELSVRSDIFKNAEVTPDF